MQGITGSRSRASGSVLLRHSLVAAAGSVPMMLMWGGAATAQAQRVGAPPESKNMQLVGYDDLQARSAGVTRAFFDPIDAQTADSDVSDARVEATADAVMRAVRADP